METIVKILITQYAILICWLFWMCPDTRLADYMEKLFKDYNKGLGITMALQIIGMILTIIIWVWDM